MNQIVFQEEHEFPQWENANQVFAIQNCFQNLAHDMQNWTKMYCAGKLIQWINFFVLSCLLGFLLALHCIMYTKINKRWSFKVFKRNRVKILSMSLLLTTIQFFKMTFMMDYADLLLLLGAQFLRFSIWTLTLINFLKSGMDLMIRTASVKLILYLLKVSAIIVAGLFISYAAYLVFFNHHVLTCKSVEFVT